MSPQDSAINALARSANRRFNRGPNDSNPDDRPPTPAKDSGAAELLPITTKRRLLCEFQATGVGWVTKGREIENYVPAAIAEAALASIDDQFDRLVDIGPFAKRWEYRRIGSDKPPRTDKVALARATVKLTFHLDELDLAERVDELVNFIRSSNL